MAVPVSQMWTVATYVLRQKFAGRKRYPLVLHNLSDVVYTRTFDGILTSVNAAGATAVPLSPATAPDQVGYWYVDDSYAHGSPVTVVEMPLFGAVAFCCYKTIAKGRDLSVPALVLAFAASLGYAAFDEWHQSFVAGRNASMSDVIVDAVGAGTMLLLIGSWPLLRGRRSRTPAGSQS